MKTKNIFKTLLLAAVLVSACEKNEIADDFKGYTVPVTINVTRQGDEPATRATYNESTKKLEFSAGDKLFVKGDHANAGLFAGPLDYDAVSGKFSGTVTTQNEYTGTIDDLMASAQAVLLPAGYESNGLFSVTGSGYEADVTFDLKETFALTKAAAVEQFSIEIAGSYSSGFALAPMLAVASFTISGLTASKEVAVWFDPNGTGFIDGNVTTSAEGVATFAIGVASGRNLENCTLRVDGNNIALPTKTVEAGHIYNISRSALPPAEGHALSASVVGEIVGSDGKAYAVVDKGNLPTGVTAVAMVAYRSGLNGLAIALTDETSSNWATAKSTCEGKTAVGGNSWHLPSQPEWQQMFEANGGDDESFTGLNSAITTAGGTGITNEQYYWTSSLDGSYPIYIMIWYGVYYDNPDSEEGASNYRVRACLAF